MKTVFADDFITLVILYFAFRIGFGIWAAVASFFMEFQSGAIALAMSAWIIYSMLKAKGMDDSRVFFRSVFQLGIIALFSAPAQMKAAVTGLLALAATLGAGYTIPTMLQAFALAGVVLAACVLYGSGKPPSKSTNQILEQVRKDVNESIDKAKSKD